MGEIKSKKEYDKKFPEKIREKAFENILDIRKFEIELYWKRATYFWTFIAATFAGYISIQNSASPNEKMVFAIILLGITFSLCWYFVNRGSKFWQLNWEKHLDAMEDGEIGPLYKTTISRAYYRSRWYRLWGPYPFSVSKINILLSFFVLLLWIGFLIDFITTHKENFNLIFCQPFNYYGYMSFFTFAFLIVIILFGRTGKFAKDQFKTHINFDSRQLSDENEETS